MELFSIRIQRTFQLVSTAIQNNVPQSTPLISKSLPVRITPNGNLLLLSQIARNLKNDSENLFSW